MGLTLSLIIIYTFVGSKITVLCSARICKGATKTVGKEMPQTHIDIFHSKTSTPFFSIKQLQKIQLRPQSHRNGMISDWGNL